MAAAVRGIAFKAALPRAIRVIPLAPAMRPISRAVTSKALQEQYSVEEKGPKESLEFRLNFKTGDKMISPWHEIPLYTEDGMVNFICEIPKETSAKMEVATDEVGTPIKQDTKKGKLRFYPYNINWNYGLLPQTWEDPAHKHPELEVSGDNDPVDVVEIGSATCKQGGVYKVKPLGVLAMIDDGELDWKVIAVNAADPKAAKCNDIADVEKEFPGEIQKVLEWFRDYKIPDGKPANKFGFDNECKGKAFTMEVIKETHEAYVALKSGARKNDEGLSLI